jgi:L-fucose isomerase-like protein
MHTFGYLSVASTLHDPQTVDDIAHPIRQQLQHIAGTPVAAADERLDEPFAILVATGGTEAQILDVVHERQAAVPFEPVLLVAHPRHNSLPSALEAMARVRADGGRGRIVQIAGDSPNDAATAVADVAAIHRLHRARLGQVGEPSPWLVASVPDAALVRERWGLELVPIDIGDTIDDFRRADRVRSNTVAVRFAGTAPVSPELADAAGLHPVLADAIEQAHVDAVTVRCFDYLGALGTSGCVALAHLNDEGVVAGCEGDVCGAVAMLLVRTLLDRPSWIANPASIDSDTDRVLLAHCTVAPSMVDGVQLHTHFESGIGIGLRGRFLPGPVTLLRLGGRALEQLWISDGEIERVGDADELCRTQVVVRLVDTSARSLLDHPLGNHLVLVHGHHRARIERWWQLAFG